MNSLQILRRARRLRGLSVREIAKRLRVNPRTVYRFEAGGGIRSALLWRIPIAYQMTHLEACTWFWRSVCEERRRQEKEERSPWKECRHCGLASTEASECPKCGTARGELGHGK